MTGSNFLNMILTELFNNILAFILGLTIVVAAIPSILKIARKKELFDSPDFRKIHKQSVPPLGGVAIFMGFIFSATFLSDDYSFISLKYIILGVILLLAVGLKDDLIGISPFKKFFIQFLAVIMLIFMGNIHITNMHGLFGFYEINTVAGALLTLFILLTIVNAFNLIDGIDGLASGLGMLAALAFGTWFFFAGFTNYAIISFALMGSLGGFFLFNVFGHKNKLFMGDTGSLFVGLIIAVLTVKFNEFNAGGNFPYSLHSAPVVSFAVVMVPLIDVLRVMTIRIFNEKSPFAADNNHIHHKLLQLMPGSHLPVTLTIIGANVFLIALALFLNYLAFGITMQFLVIFFAGITLSFIPSFLLKRIENKQVNLTELQTWPD